jgi:putative nucleotidyltransferase with HDIG domain
MSSTSPASAGLPDALAGIDAGPGWHLVGGAVRDLLTGRPVVDADIVVPADPEAAARGIARRLGGTPFPLSERHGAWRVVAPGRSVDVTASRGTIEEDLAERDFTINAIALPLDGGEPVDPTGGRADLDARLVRAVSGRVFRDDPLRLLRLPRIAHELGFAIEPATLESARADAALAGRPSGERIYAELRRMLGSADPAAALRLVDDVGALEPVLPEVAGLRGVGQSTHHHLDVLDHTLHVVDCAADLGDHPEHYLPDHAGAVRDALAVRIGDEMDARVGLRLGALFHDVCKPQTRAVDIESGRVSFMGHDREGALAAVAVLDRWHAANTVREYVRVLVAEHLRLGFMIRHRPLDRRAAHRYVRATAPYPIASIALSLADRLATRGRSSRQAHLRRHAETAEELIGLVLDLERGHRPPLLRGDEIAELTGASGAAIGALVEALAEEQAAGAVTTREEAIAFVCR